MILLIGKVTPTLMTAAPQPQMNSLKSLLLSVKIDLIEICSDVTLLILTRFEENTRIQQERNISNCCNFLSCPERYR